MVWAYYDESGEYDCSGRLLNMTIGGCMASYESWKQLDLEWLTILEREKLDTFHMTDFQAWKGQFDLKLPDGSRDKERHNRIINDILDVMIRRIDGFYGFGAVSMHDPDQPPLTHKSLMEDCVGGAIKHAVLDAADYYQEPVHLVFAQQKHFPESEIKKYIRLYDYGAAQGRIASMTMADINKVHRLQTADVFAYEMARAQRSGRPERYPFQRLLDGAKQYGKQLSITWGPLRWRKLNLSGH